MSIKSKEAIKTGLALTLVFGIAMQAGWMNPSWAGWAVAVIALPTAGQSINKGILRLVGTIPGCIAALAILSLVPQSRWGFILLLCAWMFFTAYMMIGSKKNSYFWVMAASTCLVITGSGSSEDLFLNAVFRTVETAMGVVVYTLIAVFLWPQTNLGAIKKTSGELVATLTGLYRANRDAMIGRDAGEGGHQALQGQVVQQLGQFTQVLQAEGSESYEIYELRRVWECFHGLSTGLMETLERWQTGLAELARIDVNAVLPDLQAFCAEIDSRFDEIQRLLGGKAVGQEPRAVTLTIDPAALRGLSFFDRAALTVAKKELENLEALTAAMLECARDLEGHAATAGNSKQSLSPGARGRGLRVPVPDLDQLRGATFVAATTSAGFLIWIYFDPPGHSGWFRFSGSIALIVGIIPQFSANQLIKPIAVFSAFVLATYVFIMPRLSTFIELGSLLFILTFLVCYFFSGLTRFLGMMSILTLLPIQNQQTYNFAALANAYLFFLMSVALMFGMSYMLRSPRPEKAVLHLLGRFFRSAEFLMSRIAHEPRRTSFLEHWKIAFHRHQMQALPAKLGAWSKAIDRNLFPNNTPEQGQTLVTSVQVLVHRIEQLLDAGAVSQAESVVRELCDDIEAWRAGIATTFGKWAKNPEAEPTAKLKERLATGLTELEKRVEETVNRARGGVTVEEGENFYRLLGGYRGVSEALLAYAGTASAIDWAQWREERFS